MIIPKLSGKIVFGGDYNPEQWPEDVWDDDMRLMRQAGVNLVSIGIFAWAKLQPSDSSWDFAWMDKILDLLAENNIFACLATATASPPAWLVKNHPEILPMSKDGKILYPGSRQHYSPSSSAYRKAASRLVEEIAARYKEHPALAAWHINNEYACHLPECHNEESTAGFRAWLKRRYKTIDQLNDAWGAAFWSQLYSDWDEIFTPRVAPYFSNPTQQLDFRRFTSDAFLELLLMEKSILRKHSPSIPVTTNFMGFFQPLDYHRWAEEIDFTAWDSYPDPIDEKVGRELHAAGNDLTRSLKPGQAFILMEQATSAVNWRDLNLPKRPGLMRLLSMQTIARGGDGVMYFQWRASKAGSEKYHSAVIQHCGAEKSRVFRETEQLGEELAKLSSVSSSVIQSEVAIIYDWHSWWSLEVDSRPSRIDYLKTCNSYHQWFYSKNISVDFISPDADFSKYKAVIAPSLYILEKNQAANIEKFVSEGGVFLATYFSGIVDRNDHVQLGGYPGHLKKLLGLWVEEWHPYPDGKGNQLKLEVSGEVFPCDHWADIAHADEAEVLARFESGYFANSPAFTRNKFGKGFAFYLGTRLAGAGLDYVLSKVCYETAKAVSVLEVPEGVEATIRQTSEEKFLFILNHSDDLQEILLGEIAGKDLLSGNAVNGKLKLNPLDVSVIQLQNT